MFRAMWLVFSFAIAGVGQAQTAVSPIKHLLVLAEEKGYLHEAVSHAAATIDVCRGDQVGDGPGMTPCPAPAQSAVVRSEVPSK